MHFLINCSNLKVGGGLQVADSICSLLSLYDVHTFDVVLSSHLDETANRIGNCKNVKIYKYDIKNNLLTLLFGRDVFLDGIVKKNKVNAVLTVFGPSRWNPQCAHLCGFAMPHLVLTNSPYFKLMGLHLKVWHYCRRKILFYFFKRSSNYFWTENLYISRKVKTVLRNAHVYTVSNYYNQVFDNDSLWNRSMYLEAFDGITCLTISSYYKHKNLEIMPKIVSYLCGKYPEFRFRFVTTLKKEELPIPSEYEDYFVFLGRIDVSSCPFFYKQCNLMFMPSLLECFTATYPEAMRMEVPIVTTDLEFAHGLCGDAACYYDALDAGAAAEAIYRVATDKEYARALTEAGKKQLKTFDNYEQRVEKLIHILETIAKE